MLRLQHGIRWSVGRGSQEQQAQQAQKGQGQGGVPGVSGGSGTGPGPGALSAHSGLLAAGPGRPPPLPLSHPVLRPSDFTEKVKVLFPSSGRWVAAWEGRGRAGRAWCADIVPRQGGGPQFREVVKGVGGRLVWDGGRGAVPSICRGKGGVGCGHVRGR